MTGSPGIIEEALVFGCAGEQLVGIVSRPAAGPRGDLALLVVVGGPQVRTGSHRQFTRLCRDVAAAGVPAMRFDVRGMGDSTGARLHGFEQIDDDIAAALAALRQRLPRVTRVVLWGLCDGASAALMHLHARGPAGIAGLVLLNPWVRSAQTLARAHVKHYYWNRLRQGEFWRKLLGGGVALQALRELLGNLRTARSGGSASPAGGGADLPFQQRMLLGAECFGGPVLWVLSGQDYTAKEFLELAAAQPRWRHVLEHPLARRVDLAGADHTFSAPADHAALAEATLSWLAQTNLAEAAR